MYRCLRWSALSLFAALVALSPALAADEKTSSTGDSPLTLQMPAAPHLGFGAGASAIQNPKSKIQNELRLASVPSATGFDTTLLATRSQALLQLSEPRAKNVMSRPVQWAIYGAAIGLVVGLIDEDPVEKALVGGVVGFGLGYVIRN